MKKNRRQAIKNRSFSTFLYNTMPKISTRGWFLISVCFASVTLASVIPLEQDSSLYTTDTSSNIQGISQPDAIAAPGGPVAGGNIAKGKITRGNADPANIESSEPGPSVTDPQWSTIKIRRGDSLARVLQKEKIARQTSTNPGSNPKRVRFVHLHVLKEKNFRKNNFYKNYIAKLFLSAKVKTLDKVQNL